MPLKSNSINIISDSDWDTFIEEIYKRPYCFQQQDDCRNRGLYYFTVPSEDVYDDDMHDYVPEIVNHEDMGVKFANWLARDPSKLLPKDPDEIYTSPDSDLLMWWHRNFYPDLETLVNDLHAKGLLAAGEYGIDVDW
jgi:hypothetical protein